MVLNIAYDPPNQKEAKSWKWILIDSLIIASLSLVATLPEARLPTLMELYTAVRAFFYAFVLQLAVERGLKARGNKEGEESKEQGGV
jgi:hypothetical protein